MQWFKKKTDAPPDEAAESVDHVAPDPGGAGGESWTAGRQLTTRLVAVGLWGILLCGPAALVCNVVGPSSVIAAEPAVEAVPGLSATQQFAGSHAESFVAAWLRATRHDHADLDRFIATSASTVTAERPLEYRDLSVAAVESAGEDLVSVTVSVQVADAAVETKKGEQAPVWRLRYYQVLVSTAGAELAVMGLPTQVAGPTNGQRPKVRYEDFSASSSAGETVQLFLAALLAGSGDLDRTLSPGAMVKPVTPPPYISVRTTALSASERPAEVPGSGDSVQVRADVEATLADEQSTVALTYWLTLTARDGRWEVTSIDSGPSQDALEAPEPTSDPNPSPNVDPKPPSISTPTPTK